MSEKYSRKYDIGAAAFTPNMKVVPSNLFDLMQELATMHSDELGFTLEYFIKEQKGWALINWIGEFGALPKWRDTVTVETWATSYSRLVATRNFRILDAKGNTIAKALSKWLYMDKTKRRPVRPTEEMLAAYFCGLEDVLPEQKILMPDVSKAEKINESSFVTRRSHTDSNLHVNNVNYVTWAEDGLPDDVIYGRKVKSVYVNYRKETMAGVLINTETYKVSGDEYASYIKNTEGVVLAEIIMKY